MAAVGEKGGAMLGLTAVGEVSAVVRIIVLGEM